MRDYDANKNNCRIIQDIDQSLHLLHDMLEKQSLYYDIHTWSHGIVGVIIKELWESHEVETDVNDREG